MDRKQKTRIEAAAVEPRHDRQLAVMLEGVVDLELAAGHRSGSSSPSRLVERALQLLRTCEVPEHFLASPFNPDRHPRLLELPQDD